jgi:hypothetical protein
MQSTLGPCTLHIVKRLLFNLLAGVSLLLMLAALGVWLRSHYVKDRIGWEGFHDAAFVLDIDRGIRDIDAGRRWGSLAYPAGWWYAKMQIGQNVPQAFIWDRTILDNGPDDAGSDLLEVSIPNWLLVFIASILPATWMVRTRAKFKHTASQACKHCGYDLRATPDRCTECGMVPKASTNPKLENA